VAALRQEMVNQREFVHRSEKLDFMLVNAIAGQGWLLAPATVNGWTKILHIGWTQMEVSPDRCKEQSYMLKSRAPRFSRTCPMTGITARARRRRDMSCRPI